MKLRFGTYQIRPFTPADAPALARYADDVAVWRNLRDAFPHPYRLEHAEAYIARVLAAPRMSSFAIATADEAIGSLGFMLGEDVHRHAAELGYWLAQPYWGKGIMSEAVRLATEAAFDELGLYRIFAEPYTTNPASARVLEHAGFVLEGTMRAAAVKEGHLRDMWLYAKVRIPGQ